MRIVAALGISLLLLVGLVSPVSALELALPSYLNRLKGVEHGIVSAHTRLARTFEAGTNISDLPWMNAHVRILDTTARKLDRLYDRVDTLGSPPDDSRVRDSLTNVRDTAQSIVDTVDAIPPPDDDNVRKALNEVRRAATEIGKLTDKYLAPTTIGL